MVLLQWMFVRHYVTGAPPVAAGAAQHWNRCSGKIADSAFKGFDKVESANLPKDLKVIGEQAFFGCQGLVTVTLPEGFTTLKHACFKGTGIRNVSFPKSLRSIGHASFAECQNTTGKR